MSQWNKLLRKIMEIDRNLRFVEVKKVLEAYGYMASFPNSGSSHCTFRKAGTSPITIPTHEPIAKVYVLMVKAVVEKEEFK